MKSLLIRCLGLLFVVVAYVLVSRIYSLGGRSHSLFTEIPVILAIYLAFDVFQRHKLWGWINAVILLVLFYLCFDMYFEIYGKLGRFSDFRQIPDLLTIISTRDLLLLMVVAVLLVVTVLPNFILPGRISAVFRLLPLGLLLTGVFVYPQKVVEFAKSFTPAHDTFNPAEDAQAYGRLYSMFSEQARRSHYLQQFSTDSESQAELVARRLGDINRYTNRRNIHIIVLESLFDVRQLKSFEFSAPPISPAVEKLLLSTQSRSISPSIGGGTPNAEFEILCGIPSLNLLHAIDFMTFTGQPTACLPNMLSNLGYYSIASHPYKPSTFNRARAYSSLGFEEILFAKTDSGEEQTGLEMDDLDGQWLFDGSLYEQNLQWVKKGISQNRPLLNYVLSAGGHYPFELNTENRPLMIDVEPHDSLVQRLANHAYYRFHALEKYLNELIRIDPQSLIIVINDHMPPMAPNNGYDKLKFDSLLTDDERLTLKENLLFILKEGKPISMGLMRHKDMFYTALDYVSNGRYCRDRSCRMKDHFAEFRGQNYRKGYLSLVSLASK